MNKITTIFVPGAWQGAWIWEPVSRQLNNLQYETECITLMGLEEDSSNNARAAVRLDDHVNQLANLVSARNLPVVLVAHSYSSMVTAIVADQIPELVVGLIHVGGYLPTHGLSLIDTWGSSVELRDQERADIHRDGMLWLAPTRDMLNYEPDLNDDQRDELEGKFTPHPGHTVLDVAHLNRDLSAQPTTYVALSPVSEGKAWNEAPDSARTAPNWRRHYLASGHWPLVSMENVVVELLAREIDHYSGSDDSFIDETSQRPPSTDLLPQG